MTGLRLVGLLWLAAAPAAAAAAPSCSALGIGAAPAPLPAAWVPDFNRTFGLALPPAVALRAGRVRCEEGTVLACNVGANLPCGLADTRTRLPGADAWCARHPGSAVIPAFVTGHATIYDWGCRGARASAATRIRTVDRAGYIADFWRPLR